MPRARKMESLVANPGRLIYFTGQPMFLSVRHRKPSPWVASLALLTSLLLVLGQVFHCCRINEAVAAWVSHTVEHLEGHAHADGAEEHPPLLTHHADCHSAGGPEEDSSHPMQPEEPCLSETDLAFKALEPGSPAFLQSAPATVASFSHPPQAPVPAVSGPRDPAGPPPYLLTLRLLV